MTLGILRRGVERLGVAVLVVSSTSSAGCRACAEHDEPKTVDVSISIGEGAPTALAYGRAFTALDGLEVVLTAAPIDCKTTLEMIGAHLRFDLPPGPGGRFFVGKPFGVGALAATSSQKSEAAAWDVRVELAEVTVREGGRVRGSIVVEGEGRPALFANGSFDVEVCRRQAPPAHAAQPEHASGPVSGTLGGAPFVAKSVVVEVMNVLGVQHVDDVLFFPIEGVPCGEQHRHLQDVLRVYDLGGARDGAALLSSPQPASAYRVRPDVTESLKFPGRIAPAWIAFDDLSFVAGAHVHGVVSIDGLPSRPGDEAPHVAGAFEAVVCPWAP